jgi:(p)ppGpp synthase/HD superfamily hydrolase
VVSLQFLGDVEHSRKADLPEPLLDAEFLRAVGYALRKHRTQRRKGKRVPYMEHLMGVCSLVLHYGGGQEEAIAALLHDVVEDQGGKPVLEEIRREFGERVAHIVQGCTDTDTSPKPPWEERKKAYIAHVPTADASIRLVSAADKLHNSRAILADYREIGDAVWDKFKKGRDGTLWYYREMVKALRSAPSDPRVNPLVDELERVVRALHRKVGVLHEP